MRLSKTTQEQVRRFIEERIQKPEDFRKPLNLRPYLNETYGFEELREQVIRALTIKIQASERPTSTKRLKEEIANYKRELARRDELDRRKAG